MALYTFIIFFSSWFAVLYEGFGLPVINQPARNVQSKHRTKRCACINQLDSECYYFCHLDIIWVNTPSKTTVYGLGSPLARRRRSTERCFCANPADKTCYNFCIHSSKNPAILLKSFSEPLQEKSELNADIHVASENRSDANFGTEVTEGSLSNAGIDFLTYLRNILRDRSRAMKIAIIGRQKSMGAHKPGPR